METKVAVDAEHAYTELGPDGGGDIKIYMENESGMITATWSREEALAVHSLLGHLLHG